MFLFRLGYVGMLFKSQDILGSQEWLQLSAYYLANQVCHACKARVPSYVTAPSRLHNEFRHTTETFLAESIKGGDHERLLI